MGQNTLPSPPSPIKLRPSPLRCIKIPAQQMKSPVNAIDFDILTIKRKYFHTSVFVAFALKNFNTIHCNFFAWCLSLKYYYDILFFILGTEYDWVKLVGCKLNHIRGQITVLTQCCVKCDCAAASRGGDLTWITFLRRGRAGDEAN